MRKKKTKRGRPRKVKSFTLDQIIRFADTGYDNGSYFDEKDYVEGPVWWYYKKPKGKFGDTLAKFVAIELSETFDPKAKKAKQLDTAIHTMERAKDQLDDVITLLRYPLG